MDEEKQTRIWKEALLKGTKQQVVKFAKMMTRKDE